MNTLVPRHVLTALGTWLSRPGAFLVVVAYTGLWLVFERETFDWHAVATLATWVMTLFIQRAEHRDTQAIHAKLDELLHVDENARDALTKLDEKEPEDIEAYRRHDRRTD